MQFTRIFTFLKQLLFWTPLSLIINACAIGPIMMLYSEDLNSNIIFMWPIMWVIAFFLCKLKLRLKGRRTDNYYEVEYLKVTGRRVYYDEVVFDSEHGTRIESRNTLWGWLGIILSFVAFPVQLIATLMSFVALFVPFVYSTTHRMPLEIRFTLANTAFHTLFDFVIIPAEKERIGESNPKGALWGLSLLGIPVLTLIVGGIIADLVSGLVKGYPFIGALGIIGMIFSSLSIIICIIKYTVLLVYDCNTVDLKRYARNIGILSAVASASLILGTMFS
ncbi:MAG: hypothetical protein J6B29_02350 [Clostridia bacterium]|nr:hypothetical protein [Clostridia bacterium]